MSHLAQQPGNQVKFEATGGQYAVSGDCALTNVVGPNNAIRTSSGPTDALVDSSDGETNGLATCLNATNGPAALPATPPANGGIFKPASGTAALTCN
jgi:hypothetical protein